MAVSKRTRYEVLKRDNFTCRYCRSAENAMTVDHVTPVALGGTDDPGNLVAACKDCNAGKSSSSPSDGMVADVSQRAVEWAAGIAAFNQAQMRDRKKRNAYVRRFRKAWDRWGYGQGEKRKPLPMPADWEPTVWRFYGLGLPIEELEDAVTISASNDYVGVDKTFKYMCGVLWNKVNRMQEGAKDALSASEAGR